HSVVGRSRQQPRLQLTFHCAMCDTADNIPQWKIRHMTAATNVPHNEADREERRWLMAIGAAGAILGAVLAAVGNLLHPVTPRDDDFGVAQVISQSDAWTAIHLVIIVGVLGMLAGVIGLRHALPTTGFVGAMTRYGVAAGVIGSVLGVVTVILDGVAAKQLADTWAAAPSPERATALRIVAANETMNFALAGMFNATFAGLPFIAFGLAVALSRVFPRWLGWIAVAAGFGSVLAGLIQAQTGRPTVASLVLTIIGPTVIALWMLVVGVLMARRSSR
ncbi:MAG TPA: hypothetical protein VHK06_05040, partial [Candidatus Limnocylindria bacterium]|nr:hypothetical protein [Candidatus Limnocylindria bacterium]